MKKRITDHGTYLADETFLGVYNEKTEGIVIESVMDRVKRKERVKIMRTEKISLLAGLNTVAVFKIKKGAGNTP